MTISNINDPFVLASYTSSARGKSSQKRGPGVYATSYEKSNSTDGYVTVAAHADGVHILDISTLHPIISHTLGPSTSFSCPPLTLPSSSSHASTTYAVMSASPELSSSDEAGRTLWMWQDDTLNAKQKPKQSKVILSKDQTVHGLYSCNELSGRIIALSTTGDVSVIDADSLEVKSSSSSKSSSVVHASLFPASTTTFSNGKNGTVLVQCVSGMSKTTYLRILAIDEADSISEEQKYEVPIDNQDIASVSCSSTGILSVLTLDGTLNSYRLSPGQLDPLSTPLHLAGLSFISSSKLLVSLLALTSSHVLLAAAASQEITLLLWDIQFSVLLASHTLPIPSALSASALHIRLIPGTQSQTKAQTQVLGQAILILSSDNVEHKTTSVILVVPYSVPIFSTIAAAMGRGAAGRKWVRSSEEQHTLANGNVQNSAEETARAKLLDTMRTAMQGGRPQAAAAAFMKWSPKKDEAAPSALDYNFVKELLSVILQLPAPDSKTNSTVPSTAPYAPDIFQYLLERRVVSSAMVQSTGGLLGALRARDDWKSIELAFSSVLDLTESEILESLRVVIARHRLSSSQSKATTSDDAMEVDPPASSGVASNNAIIPLPAFLNLLATYPTSRGPLLLAFKRYMQDAEDLTMILQVLDGWIARRAKLDERLLPAKKDLKKTEQGIWTVVGRRADKDKKPDEVPPLEKIVDLLQTILDASFLSLLQYPPAHKVLRSLHAQLNPEIAFANAAEGLRGPLEPFAIAQEKVVKESLIPQQEREREKQKGDWRQRRKGVGAAADIGLYQLEELVL